MGKSTDGDQTPGANASGACMSLGESIDVLVENERQIAGLMARRAEVLDEARQLSEHGVGSSSSSSGARSGGWSAGVIARRELVSSVACALRLPERTAENLIETSRILLHDLSATHKALSAGAISYRQAETIVDQATSLPADSMTEFETVVLAIAPTVTNTQLDRRAGRIRERLHPESIITRHETAVERRCVDLTPARDGMAWLNAHLPVATAIAAYNRITDLALHVEGPGEGGTLTQLRADVFADLLVDGFTLDLRTDMPVSSIDAPASSNDARPDSGRPVRTVTRGIGRGIRATVHVTVPVLSLLGVSDAPAELEGYGPIDPITAKKLAAGAPSFHRILTHPETGVVLSVGRDSYTVPRDLRRWLIIRDETCRFPGCNRAARRSDADHSLDWQHSGTTVHDNLAHLCSTHHHVKHQTAWSYTQHAGGRLEWQSPSGHRYATEPAVHFRAEIVDPDTAERIRAELDPPRTLALEHSTLTPVEALAHAERFVPHPDDPPDTPADDLPLEYLTVQYPAPSNPYPSERHVA